MDSTQGIGFWAGTVEEPDVDFETDGVWRQMTQLVTADATTIELRFYANKATSATGGNVINIDNIKVVRRTL